MKTYRQIKDSHPVMVECFFAFGNEQFAEGRKKAGLEDKKIYSYGMGLYGTKEGIKQFLDFYDNVNKEVAEQCNPQDVYDYEFNNHECGYTCNDTEAIKLVVVIFGEERTKEVKRKFGFVKLEELFQS
jgi:hypothetical protein